MMSMRAPTGLQYNVTAHASDTYACSQAISPRSWSSTLVTRLSSQ